MGNFLGGEALAAVGSSSSLIFLLTGFVNGVALGAGVLIARYFGARTGEAGKVIHTTVALGLAAGAVLTVVVILTPQILHWMGTPENVIGNSVAYFRTYFGSIADHVQCRCQHSAIGRQQPQPYEVPDYSIAH
ncbi:MAG: MATE family efflux transporter [Subdoligranulum sp.]